MKPLISKCTSILTVEEVESCLSFWVDRLGFEVTAQVPHGDRIGFAMLSNGSVEIMYQSLESVRADLSSGELTRSVLFLEVEDIGPVIEAMQGVPVVVPLRYTFYGSTEIFVREPAGNLVGFAQFKKAAS